MADAKISQLPVATTPLAGTELVPVVQTATTKQTTVDAVIAAAAASGTVVASSDVGTAPNEIPLNQYLGSLAYQDATSVIVNDLSATGNVVLGDASTDTVRVNGYMGVGSAPNSARLLGLTGSGGFSGTTQIGLSSLPTGTSAGTVALTGVSVLPTTATAVYTVADVINFGAYGVVKGAGSTITSQHGVYIADQTNGTNNYGITSLVSSGTNKWNIYASGTAANYFAGNVGIGTSSPTTALSFGTPTQGTAVISIPAQFGFDVIRRLSASGSGFNFGALYSSGAPYIGYQVKTNSAAVGYLSSTSVTIGRSVISMDASLVNIQTGASQTSTDGGAVTLVDNVQFTPTTAVFNEGGADIDFRVESDTNTHALFVDAGNSRVGVNNSTPAVDLDVTGQIRASTGILFGTDTAAANALDDYEEGTWTPVFADATSGGNVATYTSTGGTYTKIGRIVHYTWFVSNIDTTGMTGANDLVVRGFPFASTGSGYALGSIYANQLTQTANYTTFNTYIGTGVSYSVLIEVGNNNSSRNVTVSQCSSGIADIRVSGTYQV